MKTPYVDRAFLIVSIDEKLLNEVLRLKAFIEANILGERFLAGVPKPKKGKVAIGNFLHLDDIEEFSEDWAAQYPTLSASDLVLSLRYINLIAVIVRKSYE